MKYFSLLIPFLIFFSSIIQSESIFLAECKSDQEKYCREQNQPKAKIAQCLLEHTDDLSDVCLTALKSYSEQMSRKGRGPCKEDVSKFCKWIIPGGGRIIKCLFQNEKELSIECRKSLNE